jgi:hypothetical protein
VERFLHHRSEGNGINKLVKVNMFRAKVFLGIALLMMAFVTNVSAANIVVIGCSKDSSEALGGSSTVFSPQV